MHGEEEVLVAERLDELEFLFDEGGDVVRHAVRPAFGGAFVDEPTQVLASLDARRDQLRRVFVAQFVEGKPAAFGYAHGLVQHLFGVKLEETLDGAQVAFAVRLRGGAEFRHRGPVGDRGEQVLQGLALRRVHVRIVAGDDGQVEARRQGEGVRGLVEVRGFEEHLEGDPEMRQARAEQAAFGHQLTDGLQPGDPERETRIDRAAQVFEAQRVFALGAAPPRLGDQRPELAVGEAARCQQHKVDVFREVEFGADDEVDAVAVFFARLGGHVRPHRAGHGTLVGDGDGGVAEIVRALDEFLRVRGAAQEGEVRDRVQFGERRLSLLGLRRSSHGETTFCLRPGCLCVGASRRACGSRISSTVRRSCARR